MSNPEPPQPPQVLPPQADTAETPAKGLSLTLVYSLIALALFIALGIAAMIVLPFHHRR
jgi:hypothetical protein